MVKTLLVNLRHDGYGGRAQLSDLLTSSLQEINAEELDVFSLRPKDSDSGVLERLVGRIDGISSEIERYILQRLSITPPERIILDGSNLGRIARVVKKTHPSFPVLTFYHNVEARFFYDALRTSKTVRAAAVLWANVCAERWATRYSDRRIMLNARDARLLGKLYGRPGTDVLPMALRDQYDPQAITAPRPFTEPYALFVGGAFYANIEGMAWYAENVAPHAPIDTVVVGRGMTTHRARLEQWGKVHVVGEVEKLAPWYAHAQIVVAPILSGSGMKTKTAEALMHGKKIAGTNEAFEGYDLSSSADLSLCNTAEDFVSVLQRACTLEARSDPKLRSYYLQNNSESAMREKLRKILGGYPGAGS